LLTQRKQPSPGLRYKKAEEPIRPSATIDLAAPLLFGLGLAGAFAGGELFVRGVLAAGRQFRLPAGFVAATLGAFATSGPELGVSVFAALEAKPQIGLGDALGSNVVNLGLVLGLTVLLARLRVARRESLARIPFMVAAPALVGALVMDGRLTRLDAALLLGVFAAWLTLELRSLERPPGTPAAPRERRPIALGAAGLLVLFASAKLIVSAALTIAAAWGVEGFLFGATVLAVGTSIPELATALVSRARGHPEVGLGTLLGSNLFNGLFIVGMVALIDPIELELRQVAVPLAAAALLSLLLIAPGSGLLGRARGALLLAGYAAYLAVLAKEWL
jgi:cation:H+ antiporter